MLVEVRGTYNTRDGISNQIADMCRYNGCTMLEVLEDNPIPDLRAHRKFRVLLECQTYTPERWSSFSLRSTTDADKIGQAKQGWLSTPKESRYNALYDEFDNLTDAQLDYFLDEIWRLYPGVYTELYQKANKDSYVMAGLMMEKHSKIFNSIMVRALKQ